MKAVRLVGDDEAMDVTFERADGTHVVVTFATESAGWLATAELLDEFGTAVVAPTPEDCHDPTYAGRAETFLSAHHAPLSVLATFQARRVERLLTARTNRRTV